MKRKSGADGGMAEEFVLHRLRGANGCDNKLISLRAA